MYQKYEALDRNGHPYLRKPKTIDELPTCQERVDAIAAIKPVLEKLIGRSTEEPIHYGEPIFRAFGIEKAQFARRAPFHSKLLLTRASDLPLSLLKMSAAG